MSVELKVPRLGESISEATIAKWMKQVGDAVAADEPIADLETDKITIALPAPAAGVLTEQRFPVGSTVKVGDVIGAIAEGATNGAPSKKAAPVAVAAPAPVAAAPAPVAATAKSDGASATPAAVTTQRARPLTPHQRKALREGAIATAAAPDGAADRVPVNVRIDAPDEIVAMTPLRRRIAERLVEAQQTAAILTTFNEVDMTNIMALRARYQESFTAQYGIKLGFMSFFAKAAVESLKRFPGLNAEIRGNDIIYKKRYDLGIAVGGGKGLVVPVLRGVDQMGFAEIEQTIANLAKKAKDNRLSLDELTGGTFSITNGGIYGSMLSTPLLNLPQTGILGMHNIIKRPIAVGESIELRPMMYLALSYDHRVVDGREAVQFLVGIKERIENPERLMLAL